jgi:hypothetical protein
VGQALLSDRMNLPDMLAGKAYVMSCVVNLALGDTLTRIKAGRGRADDERIRHPYVNIAVRILVAPADAAPVNAVQDGSALQAGSEA